MLIELIDNSVKGNAKVYERSKVAALFPIADKTISELCRDNENLLIFPYSIADTDDRIGEASIFSLPSAGNEDMIRIETGNVMGFLGVGDLQVKIKSRFDSNRDDYLLHYMLQRVLSFNLFDLNHDNEREDVFDFIMFMFPYFLKSALRQGVYREYHTFLHNDANVKGTIDVGRHISKNSPFTGKIAYSTREYSRDNSVTQLIRHTIEFMKAKRYGQSVLNVDNETKENVVAIIECTPSYSKSERSSVISKNLRMRMHPYYTAYRPLQSLCLQILRTEEVKYGENEDEICGILFDGAWLWEEYVNTILESKDKGFKHAENKLKKNGIFLFEDNSGIRYPDFYKDGFVLDAKYKRLGGYKRVAEVGRDDVHQVIAYMNRLKAQKGGFVVPLVNAQEKVPTSQLKNSDATMSIYGIEICKEAKSYHDFCAKMQKLEISFVDSLETN